MIYVSSDNNFFLTLVHHHDSESSFPTQPVSLVKEFELSVVL